MPNTHRLQIQEIEDALTVIESVFLNSPQYNSPGLSERFDADVIIKIETLNPIKSFKARGSEVLASRASRDTPIICASAGNFGQAMAYSCTKRQIPVTVYASKYANQYKVDMMRAFGANVIQEGNDFDAAKEIARKKAHYSDARFVEDSADIETLIGSGTIGLELSELPSQLDYLLIPLGNGALFSGIARVMKDRSPATQLIAVQSVGAPAMIESMRKRQLIAHDHVNTIADGIAVRLPVQQSLIDLDGLVDDTLLVSEQEIISSIRLIHDQVGIIPEPSAVVGVAAIAENRDRFKNKRIGTILCGGNLTEEQKKEWLV